MAEKSSRAQNERGAVNDLAVGQPIRVSHGILAGATGVVERMGESRECGLKVEGWPEGVYVIVVNDATRLEHV